MQPDWLGSSIEELRRQLRLFASSATAGDEYLDSPEGRREAKRLIGIIDSMTTEERLAPARITEEQRRRRIAHGAGVALDEMDRFIKQFNGFDKLVRRIRRMRGR